MAVLDYYGKEIYSDFGVFKIQFEKLDFKNRVTEKKVAIVTHDMLMTFLVDEVDKDEIISIDYLGLGEEYKKEVLNR